MKIVDDARDWWKWNSTHVAAMFAAMPIAWSQVPPEFKAYIPEAAMPLIGFVMFIGYMAARLRAQ